MTLTVHNFSKYGLCLKNSTLVRVPGTNSSGKMPLFIIAKSDFVISTIASRYVLHKIQSPDLSTLILSNPSKIFSIPSQISARKTLTLQVGSGRHA